MNERDIFGVIGDPISHSLSPLMHEQWYRDFGLPHIYQKFHVTPVHLKEAVQAVRTMNIKGINVTVPHKEAIVPLLDELTLSASRLNAVNTVINRNGRLIGHNTDGEGFIKSVRERWPLLGAKPSKWLLIGAGGASRALTHSINDLGTIDLAITNRTYEKAALLAGEIGKPARALSIEEAEKRLADFDAVVQATSVGMKEDKLPIDMANLRSDAYCIDIIYSPSETVWLRDCKDRGAQVMNGLPMLINQGALAFEAWLGLKPETGVMENILLKRWGHTDADK